MIGLLPLVLMVSTDTTCTSVLVSSSRQATAIVGTVSPSAALGVRVYIVSANLISLFVLILINKKSIFDFEDINDGLSSFRV